MTETSGQAAPRRPRRQLVVCCDGTSNTLTGGQRDTNVVRLVDMLQAGGSRSDPDQLVYYDPGVGSPDGLPPTGLLGFLTGPARQVLGLAVGSGIYDNIGEAYLFLCREYGKYETLGAATTEDEIYLFGFSRGAFTVRAVAGMVNMFGLIRPEQEQLLPMLLNVYFTPRPDQQATTVKGLGMVREVIAGGKPQLSRTKIAEQVRMNFTTPIGADARIHFIGVWDTVKSVGVPGLRKEITNDATIDTGRFTHVRHLLSLDEHRRQFLPRPFTGNVRENQSLRQLWVRGVHGDVGGGGNRSEVLADGTRRWTVSALSEVTFRWMIAEAQQVGLRHVADAGEAQPGVRVLIDRRVKVTDQLYAVPWWTLTGMALRQPIGVPAGNILRPENSSQLASSSENLTDADVPPQAWSFVDGHADHPSVAGLCGQGSADVLLRPIDQAKQPVDVAYDVASGRANRRFRAADVSDGQVSLDGVEVSTPWSTLKLSTRLRALLAAVLAVFAAVLLSRATGEWPIQQLGFSREPTALDLLAQLGMLVATLYVMGLLATRAYSSRLTWRRAASARPTLELRGAKKEIWQPSRQSPRMVRLGALVLRLEPGVLTVSPLGNVVSFAFAGGVGAILAQAFALTVGWEPAAVALRAVSGAFAVLAWAGVLGLLVLLLDALRLAAVRRESRAVGYELLVVAGLSGLVIVLYDLAVRRLEAAMKNDQSTVGNAIGWIADHPWSVVLGVLLVAGLAASVVAGYAVGRYRKSLASVPA